MSGTSSLAQPPTWSLSPSRARPSADYSIFADPDFNPRQYAHRVLAGDEPIVATRHTPHDLTSSVHLGSTYNDSPIAKGDIAFAVAQLTFGIEDVSKQIKSLITTKYDVLLDKATSVNELDNSVKSIRHGLTELDSSLEKLRSKIHLPYQTLTTHVIRLQQLQRATDALRRTSRFILLARRLDYQISELNKSLVPSTTNESNVSTNATPQPTPGSVAIEDTDRESILSKAALTTAELEALLNEEESQGSTDSTNIHVDDEPLLIDDGQDVLSRESAIGPIPLRYINIVVDHIPAVQAAKKKIVTEMDAMTISGLAEQNQPRLSSALQTAHNLSVLPKMVQRLVNDFADAVQSCIKQAFDMSRIAKDASKDVPVSGQSLLSYKSRVRTEPTNQTAPQWTSALWSRLENLIEELASCCIKVYMLEKVLRIKRDGSTNTTFLEQAMTLLEEKPSTTFWGSLAKSLEKQSRDAMKSSTFLHQTLGQGYPQLLRLFHDFFSKIAVHTNTVYTELQQSAETILVLKALSPFESFYLARSSNKLNEVVAQSFSGGVRSPPSLGEGLAIARAVNNELDAARFDPLLVRSVAKNVVAVLDNLLGRIETMSVKDRSATIFIGSALTPQQASNAQLATAIYHCWSRLKKGEEDYSQNVTSIISPSVDRLWKHFADLTDPVLTALRKDLSSIISRVHRLDLSRDVMDASTMAGSSPYIKELSERLAFIKNEILSRMNAGDCNRDWLLLIVRHVLRTFINHITIAKPLGESGKLQLTSDMTELEFALSAFIADNPQSKTNLKMNDIGSDFQTLRALRPLLFLDNAHLSDSNSTTGLPPLVVLHHILVRSPLQLPHTLHGWQEAEYCGWLDEHTMEDALSLVEGDLIHWEKIHDGDTDIEGAGEYIVLCREVLSKVRL